MKAAKLTICLIIGGSGLLFAQRANPDQLQRYLFPPELVMKHQQALGLTDQQRDYIIAQIQEAQSQFTPMQWGLQNDVERLASLLEQEDVEEAELLDQLDRVLEQERQIKRVQFRLGMRIRSRLTPEQRTKLERIRLMFRRQAESGPGPEPLRRP